MSVMEATVEEQHPGNFGRTTRDRLNRWAGRLKVAVRSEFAYDYIRYWYEGGRSPEPDEYEGLSKVWAQRIWRKVQTIAR